MVTVGREQMFFKILVFFSVVTAMTGILNMANAGTVSLGDFGSGNYMQTIPGQSVPNLGVSPGGSDSGTTAYGTQDYTTDGGYNHNITVISESLGSPMWTRSDGVGFQSSYTPVTYPYLAYFSVQGGASENNNYDFVYHVFNQFSGYPFYTLVSASETGSGDMSGFFIKYGTDGIGIVNNNDVEHPIQFIPMPYANTAQTIETVYDSTLGTVNVYIDGSFAGTFSQVSYAGVSLGSGTGGASSSSGVYYVGLAASHSALDVSSIDGTFVVDNPVSWWDSIINKWNGLVIFGSQFFSVIGSLVGLTSNPLVPFWLWAIIAIPCIATLILIYIQIARGD